jgi:transcriptional regulator with XRE-family HTH domain
MTAGATETDEKRRYGYVPVEALVFAFVKASRLIPKSDPLYFDIRELAAGKRRFYRFWDAPPKASKNNAKDFPGVAKALEKELAQTWATPDIASEVASRLADYIRSYLQDFVRVISAANIESSRVTETLRPVFFAQRIAVDLSWLEQRWGIGLLPRLLPEAIDKAASDSPRPTAIALKWLRRLEGFSAAQAAAAAGKDYVDVRGQMDRWENGRHMPRQDSLPLVRDLYGMNKKVRYRFWFWVALLLEEAGPEFRREIAACLGRGFDLATARRPFIELSNSLITSLGVPEAFTELDRLLCRQSTTRKQDDLENAMSALEELKQFVGANKGIAEYHVYAMQARIAVFSRQPARARDLFVEALSLARYAEPTTAERLSRELAALCVHEGYAVPLKNVTDTQWLFGLHPIQTRRAAYDDDETLASATELKRGFDYVRYFPPQLFFDKTEQS